MDEPVLNAVVTLRNEVSPWLMILQVVPDGWELPDYVPGHFTLLGLPGSASRCFLAESEVSPADPYKLIKRAYCIASSPANCEFLEFYIALVPGGALSPRLFNLRIGDRIWFSPKISGKFTYDDSQVPKGANLVLMATGSGLAPFISMLSTFLGSRPDNTHVFMGGSPQMSEEMLQLLSRKGFTEDRKNEPGQVHVEKYWQL